ncbi:MAG: uracil-DNA glycosylase [Phycisphaerales bacterium JB040]
MDSDRLLRVVRQHAETATLLGVDFLPIGGSRGGEPGRGVEPGADRIAEPKPVRVAAGGDGGRGAMLEALRARYEADAPHRHFVTDHHSIVFGEGSPEARLMFVGEAPGAEEDKTGRPFVGRAGQLLDKMIVAMGLTRESVYICNVLKTRPPNNATPTLEEVRLCAPYLFGQIGIIRPAAIVTLGLPASRLLLDSSEAMGKLRGRRHEFEIPGGFDAGIVPAEAVGTRIPVFPTYHPAYILRSYTPENRAKVWSDMQLAMKVL